MVWRVSTFQSLQNNSISIQSSEPPFYWVHSSKLILYLIFLDKQILVDKILQNKKENNSTSQKFEMVSLHHRTKAGKSESFSDQQMLERATSTPAVANISMVNNRVASTSTLLQLSWIHFSDEVIRHHTSLRGRKCGCKGEHHYALVSCFGLLQVKQVMVFNWLVSKDHNQLHIHLK